jgi:hypothetical protein
MTQSMSPDGPALDFFTSAYRQDMEQKGTPVGSAEDALRLADGITGTRQDTKARALRSANVAATSNMPA